MIFYDSIQQGIYSIKLRFPDWIVCIACQIRYYSIVETSVAYSSRILVLFAGELLPAEKSSAIVIKFSARFNSLGKTYFCKFNLGSLVSCQNAILRIQLGLTWFPMLRIQPGLFWQPQTFGNAQFGSYRFIDDHKRQSCLLDCRSGSAGGQLMMMMMITQLYVSALLRAMSMYQFCDQGSRWTSDVVPL